MRNVKGKVIIRTDLCDQGGVSFLGVKGEVIDGSYDYANDAYDVRTALGDVWVPANLLEVTND